MKKIFRLFIAGILAVLMCLSVVAFTACGDGSDDVKDSITPEETEQLFSDDSYSALGINGTMSMGGMKMTIDGKLNFNGNMDFKMSASGVPTAFKVYMRDWKIYTDEGEGLEGVLDLPEAVAGYINNSFEDMLPVEVSSEMVSSLLVSAKDIIPEALNVFNAYLVKYCNEFNGIAVTGDTVTLDINKTMYNQIQAGKALLDSVTANTTLSDILNSDYIKKMFNTLGGSGTEFRAQILQVISAIEDGLEGEEAQIAILLKSLLNSVQADSNSTIYEYIVKIASSSEFALIFKSALGISIDKTDLTQLTILELANLAGEVEISESELSSYIAMYKQQMNAVLAGITESSYDMGEVAVKNAKMVYNITGKTVSSQTFSCNLAVSTEAGAQQMDISVTATYAKTAYSLDNLSDLPEIGNSGTIVAGDIEGKTFISEEGFYMCFTEGQAYMEVDGKVMYLGNYYVSDGYLIMNGSSLRYTFDGERLIVYASEGANIFMVCNYNIDIDNSEVIEPSNPGESSKPGDDIGDTIDPSNPAFTFAGQTYKVSHMKYLGSIVSLDGENYMVFDEYTVDIVSNGEVSTAPYTVKNGVITIESEIRIESTFDFDGKTLVFHDYGFAGIDLYCTVYTGEIEITPEPTTPDENENNDPFNGGTFVISTGEYEGTYLIFKEGTCYDEGTGMNSPYKYDDKVLVMFGMEFEYAFSEDVLYLFSIESNNKIMLYRK